MTENAKNKNGAQSPEPSAQQRAVPEPADHSAGAAPAQSPTAAEILRELEATKRQLKEEQERLAMLEKIEALQKEIARKERLKAEIEKDIKYQTMRGDALEYMIGLAEKQYGIEILPKIHMKRKKK
jgi:hypothetical protein